MMALAHGRSTWAVVMSLSGRLDRRGSGTVTLIRRLAPTELEHTLQLRRRLRWRFGRVTAAWFARSHHSGGGEWSSDIGMS